MIKVDKLKCYYCKYEDYYNRNKVACKICHRYYYKKKRKCCIFCIW